MSNVAGSRFFIDVTPGDFMILCSSPVSMVIEYLLLSTVAEGSFAAPGRGAVVNFARPSCVRPADEVEPPMQKPFEDDFIPAPRLSAALRDLTGDPGPGMSSSAPGAGK